jgi:penicillin amidase
LWRRGEYINMSLDPDLAKAASNGTTKIIPVPNLQ